MIYRLRKVYRQLQEPRYLFQILEANALRLCIKYSLDARKEF